MGAPGLAVFGDSELQREVERAEDCALRFLLQYFDEVLYGPDLILGESIERPGECYGGVLPAYCVAAGSDAFNVGSNQAQHHRLKALAGVHHSITEGLF
jgi:hypothetical protein